MHLVRSLLVVAAVTPLAVSNPAGTRVFRRTAEDDKENHASSIVSIPSSVTLPASSFVAIQSKDQSSTPPKDLPSFTASLPQIPDKNQPTSISIPDKEKDSSSSLPSKDDKTSSSVSAKDQSSSSAVGFSYGTGVASPPESIQEIVTTEVVYTTLTTCPVTSTVTSGTKTTEEVTTIISTATRTSTFTLCTKCVAPPKSKPELPSPSAGETLTSFLPSVIIYSLTQPAAGLAPLKASTSPEAGKIGTGGAPIIVYSFTIPTAPPTATSAATASSKLEVPLGTAATFSQSNLFNTLSLTVSGISIPSIPGYAIVPSPTRIPMGPGPFSNATSTVIPVFSAGLLGNAYGGGFVKTASLFVTKLPFPNGPTEGVPPGYVSTSKAEASVTVSSQLSALPVGLFNNSANVFPGVSPNETTSATFSIAFFPANAGTPTLSATTAKNQTNVFGSNVVGPATTVTLGAAGSESETSVASSESQVTIGGLSPSFNVLGASAVAQGGSIQAHASFQTANTPSAVIVASLGETEASAFPVTTPKAVSADSSSLAVGTLVGTQQAHVLNNSPAISASAQPAITTEASPPITLPAEGSLVPLASQTLVEIGAVGSPISSFGETQGVPITRAAQSPEVQVSASAQPAATILSPLIGANGLTSFAQVSAAAQPAASVLTPVVGAKGVTNLAQAPAPTQSAAAILTPVVGANGVTSLVPVPAQPGATEFTPIVGANGVTSLAAVPSPFEQASALATTATVLTPVVGANDVTSLVPVPARTGATEFTPVVGANGVTSLVAVPSPLEQPSAPALTAATVLTPVVGANGVTSLAVIPTPVVGANGLTSLAIFSTPVAAANGVTPPAVILTPVVGANGLTSLAVLATPVVGANGLTSLAIGLASEQTAAQPNGTPSPVEASVLIPGQAATPASPVIVSSATSGITLPSGPPPNSGSGSSTNTSVHVPFNPSPIAEFQGSAVRLSLSFGAGGLIVLLFLL